MKQKHFIDSHKGATPIFVLVLIWWFGAWEQTAAWLYLALHGTYGVLWVTKSALFGDTQWEQRTSLWYGLVISGGLTLYWISPYLIVTRNVAQPPWYLAACVSVYAAGIFLHFVADMQKHTSLALRPGLITTGLWSRTRNPNYLGELLIYLGFVLLAGHCLPVLVLALVFAAVWIPNMLRKDRALARYPGFADYKARTGLFLPRLF